MDIYAKTVKLNDKDFKEIIGVKRTTFEAMVTILKKAKYTVLRSISRL